MRIVTLVVSLLCLIGCSHQSHDDIRKEGVREGMRLYADQHQQSQKEMIGADVDPQCMPDYPETMTIKVRGGVVGNVYYPTQLIPVFTEQAEIEAKCKGRE